MLYNVVYFTLYALESNKDCSLRDRCARADNRWRCSWEWHVPPRSRAISDCHRLDALVCGISLRDGYSDGWDWLLDSGHAFTVKHLSMLIDGITLGGNNVGKTHQWNPLIPRKINIFVWRLALNRLPLLMNLDDRGLDIPSVLCPLCNDAPESVNHLFLHCSKVKLVWFKCLSWWGVSTVIHNMSVKEVIAGSFMKLLPPCLQNIFQGVCLVTLWSVWKWINKVAHATIEFKSKEHDADIFSMIQANSLLWISNRWSKKSVIPNWKSWVTRPRGIYDDIANLST
ncbi:RNA-directed DNA polymerase, eukaryota, reverse transcriptase zinc-binding domain protein [Tanacetum coccineum]